MEYIAVLVLVLVAMFGSGSALRCQECISSKSFEACELMGEVHECNVTIVNANHEKFNTENPTLLQGNQTNFKCYRVQLARLFPNGTDTGLRGYARGCTFNSTDFCAGWVRSWNVTSCGTCTMDLCDQNPVLPTNAPATTTVLPGTATTTVNPGATSTSTKKPNGATTILQFGATTLAFISVLGVVAGQYI